MLEGGADGVLVLAGPGLAVGVLLAVGSGVPGAQAVSATAMIALLTIARRIRADMTRWYSARGCRTERSDGCLRTAGQRRPSSRSRATDTSSAICAIRASIPSKATMPRR